jgi:GGDEF domain-containing protein
MYPDPIGRYGLLSRYARTPEDPEDQDPPKRVGSYGLLAKYAQPIDPMVDQMPTLDQPVMPEAPVNQQGPESLDPMIQEQPPLMPLVGDPVGFGEFAQNYPQPTMLPEPQPQEMGPESLDDMTWQQLQRAAQQRDVLARLQGGLPYDMETGTHTAIPEGIDLPQQRQIQDNLMPQPMAMDAAPMPQAVPILPTPEPVPIESGREANQRIREQERFAESLTGRVAEHEEKVRLYASTLSGPEEFAVGVANAVSHIAPGWYAEALKSTKGEDRMAAAGELNKAIDGAWNVAGNVFGAVAPAVVDIMALHGAAGALAPAFAELGYARTAKALQTIATDPGDWLKSGQKMKAFQTLLAEEMPFLTNDIANGRDLKTILTNATIGVVGGGAIESTLGKVMGRAVGDAELPGSMRPELVDTRNAPASTFTPDIEVPNQAMIGPRTPDRRVQDVGPPEATGERRGIVESARDMAAEGLDRIRAIVETDRRAAARTTDKLTGLQDKNAFEDARQAIDDDPDREWLALDLRNSKAINDILGHDAGNERLFVRAATLLKQMVEEVGGVGFRKSSGDEYAAAVPKGTAEQISKRMKEAFQDELVADGHPYVIGIDVGYGDKYKIADDMATANKKARTDPSFRGGPGNVVEPPVERQVVDDMSPQEAEGQWLPEENQYEPPTQPGRKPVEAEEPDELRALESGDRDAARAGDDLDAEEITEGAPIAYVDPEGYIRAVNNALRNVVDPGADDIEYYEKGIELLDQEIQKFRLRQMTGDIPDGDDFEALRFLIEERDAASNILDAIRRGETSQGIRRSADSGFRPQSEEDIDALIRGAPEREDISPSSLDDLIREAGGTVPRQDVSASSIDDLIAEAGGRPPDARNAPQTPESRPPTPEDLDALDQPPGISRNMADEGPEPSMREFDDPQEGFRDSLENEALAGRTRREKLEARARDMLDSELTDAYIRMEKAGNDEAMRVLDDELMSRGYPSMTDPDADFRPTSRRMAEYWAKKMSDEELFDQIKRADIDPEARAVYEEELELRVAGDDLAQSQAAMEGIDVEKGPTRRSKLEDRAASMTDDELTKTYFDKYESLDDEAKEVLGNELRHRKIVPGDFRPDRGGEELLSFGLHMASDLFDSLKRTKLGQMVTREIGTEGGVPKPIFEAKLKNDAELRALYFRASERLQRAIDGLVAEYGPDVMDNMPDGLRRQMNVALTSERNLTVDMDMPFEVFKELRLLGRESTLIRKKLEDGGYVTGKLLESFSERGDMYMVRAFKRYDPPMRRLWGLMRGKPWRADQSVFDNAVEWVQKNWKLPKDEAKSLIQEIEEAGTMVDAMRRTGRGSEGAEIRIGQSEEAKGSLKKLSGFVSRDTRNELGSLLSGRVEGAKVKRLIDDFIDPEIRDDEIIRQIGAEHTMLRNRLLDPDANLSKKARDAIEARQRRLESIRDDLWSRREIPEPIRELLGEEHNPLVRIAKTLDRQGQMLAGARNAKAIVDTGLAEGWIRKSGTIPRDSASRWKRLSSGDADLKMLTFTDEDKVKNLMIDGDMYELIKRRFGQTREMNTPMRVLMGVTHFVKGNMTYRNPGTHARNFFGASMFPAMSGLVHPFNLGRQFKYLKKAYAISGNALDSRAGKRFDEQLNKVTERMIELDVIDSSVKEKEFADNAREIMNDFRGDIERWIDSRHSEFGGRFGKIKDTIGDADQWARDWYRREDDIAKLFVFMGEVDEIMGAYERAGKSISVSDAEVRAARIVNDTYPNYNRLSPAIQDLRRFPLMSSFPSFAAEVVRTTKNQIKLAMEELDDPVMKGRGLKRLAGMAQVMVAPQIAAVTAGAMLGMGEEEVRALRRDQGEFQNLNTIIPLWKNDDGSVYFMDLGYMDVTNNLRSGFMAFAETLEREGVLGTNPVSSRIYAAMEGLKESADVFTQREILFGLAMELVNNQDRWGNPVRDGGFWEQVGDIMTHTLSKTMPPPLKTAGRVVGAAKGEFQSNLTRPPVWAEAAEPFGVRVRLSNPKKEFSWRIGTAKGQLDQANDDLVKVLKDPNDVPVDKLMATYKSFEEKRRRAMEAASEAVLDTRYRDTSPAVVVQGLKMFDKADRTAIMGGFYMPEQFGPQTLESHIRQVRSEALDPADAYEIEMRIRERVNILRQVSGRLTGSGYRRELQWRR